MEDVTIEAQISLPEVQEGGEEAFVKRASQEYGISVIPTGEKENGFPVFTFKGPRDKIDAFIAKEFEGGDYNIDDFIQGGEDIGDVDDEPETMADTEVVDTTDGVSPNEEDSMVKAIEALDEQARSRILARFSKKQPDTSVEGTSLAKLVNSLRY